MAKKIDEKEEFKKCIYCTHFKKGSCILTQCPYIEERIGFGQITFSYIAKDCFKEFTNKYFWKRLRESVRCFHGEWFSSPYHRDRYTSLKESSSMKLKKHNEQLAIMYILSSDEELWQRSKNNITRQNIDLASINLKGISTNSYALYQAAKTIFTGNARIEESELADDRLISFFTFKTIINAFMIARYGDQIMSIKD